MDMNQLVQLSEAAMAVIGPYLASTAGKAVDAAARSAGEKLFNWLWEKLNRSIPRQTLEQARQFPTDEDALDQLRFVIQREAERDEAFRSELLERLPATAKAAISQTAIASGNGSVASNVVGSNNSITIGGGNRKDPNNG